jgi:hypothetical protein
MEFIESVLRMSAFEKYFDPTAPFVSSMLGRTMVDMVHFDYTDLSSLDEWIKRFVPFWVWTSRNLPLQMRMLLESPRNINMYIAAQQAWNESFDYEADENGILQEKEFLTSELRWVLPFRREDAAGTWVQMTWQPGIPFMDLLETPLFKGPFAANMGGIELPVSSQAFDVGQWVGWASGSLAPELSLFNDLATSPGQEFKTRNAPAGLNGLLRTVGVDATPQGDVQVPRWVGALVGTALPFYTEYMELAGVRSNSPYSAGNQGLLPDEFQGDPGVGTMLSVIGQRFGRGFGFEWQSPEDAFWTYKELQRWVEAERLELRGNLSIAPDSDR